MKTFFVILFLLILSGATAQHTIFKADDGYEKNYGIVAEDTLKNGMILFKTVEKEEDINEVIGIDEVYIPDSRSYYAYKYNIGKTPKNLLFPQWFYSIELINEKYFLVHGDYYELYDLKGKELIETRGMLEPTVWNDIFISSNYIRSSNYSVDRNYLYSLISLNSLKELVKDTFSYVLPDKKFLFLVNYQDILKNTVFDKSMNNVLGDKLAMVQHLSPRDHFIVYEKKNYRMGILNDKKEVLLPVRFTRVTPVSTNIKVTTEHYSYDYLIDARTTDSTFLFNNRYKLLFALPEPRVKIDINVPFIKFSNGDYSALIDTAGRPIVPYNKYWLKRHDQYIEIQKWNGFSFDIGWYNYEGTEVFPPIYKKITIVNSNMVLLYEKEDDYFDRITLADIKGKVYSKEPYQIYRGSSDGILMFQMNRKFFLYDENGVYLFSMEADNMSLFINGEAKVFFKKKAGIINKKGEWISKPSSKLYKTK